MTTPKQDKEQVETYEQLRARVMAIRTDADALAIEKDIVARMKAKLGVPCEK